MPEIQWDESLRQKFYWMIKFQLSRDFEFVLKRLRLNPKIEWAIEPKVEKGKTWYALWRDKSFLKKESLAREKKRLYQSEWAKKKQKENSNYLDERRKYQRQYIKAWRERNVVNS